MTLPDPADGPPPFHLVNRTIGKHMGPFSTYLDAVLARTIGSGDWPRADVMDNDMFDQHLGRSSS